MIKFVQVFCVLIILFSTTHSVASGIECLEKECKQYFKAYKKFAKNGSPVAQEILGNLYLSGYGVKKNKGKAAKWFKKAAKHGHYGARLELANMYLDGKGLKQDIPKAIELYESLADKGVSQSAFKLGVIYGQGKFIKQDYLLAEKWLTKAGTTSSKFMLARMYESNLIKGKGIEQAKAIYQEIEGINPYAASRLEAMSKPNSTEQAAASNTKKQPIIQIAQAPKSSKMEVIQVRANINDFLLDNLLAIKEQGIYNSKSGTGSRIRGQACEKSRGCNAATDAETIGKVLNFWSRHQGTIQMTESDGYGT